MISVWRDCWELAELCTPAVSDGAIRSPRAGSRFRFSIEDNYGLGGESPGTL
ncbi:hypothetical protein [Thermogutta sp.]|uniref:hypothetical protein n=1 Tax=Thermogutta sp. TaxID=1962930 RepID=UPI0032202E93